MPTTTVRNQTESQSPGWGTRVPFDAVHEPGTYVCNWSGHLIRLPDDSIQANRSPTMTILGKEPLFVTKISNDPFVSLSKARQLAADCDLLVNF